MNQQFILCDDPSNNTHIVKTTPDGMFYENIHVDPIWGSKMPTPQNPYYKDYIKWVNSKLRYTQPPLFYAL